MSERTIKIGTFRELLAANAVTRVLAVGVRGGFKVSIDCSNAVCLLSNSKGEPRCFVSLNTLSNYLAQCGVMLFEVNASSYQRARLRKPRPDRSAALKKTRTQPTLELV